MIKKLIFLIGYAAFGLIWALPLAAQTGGQVAVEVVDNSNDRVGKSLVQDVREKVKGSEALRLTTENEPRIRMVILTVDPKLDTPRAGAIYSILWLSLNRSSSGFLPPIFLHSKLGYCTDRDIKITADKAMEDTQKVLGEYLNALKRSRPSTTPQAPSQRGRSNLPPPPQMRPGPPSDQN